MSSRAQCCRCALAVCLRPGEDNTHCSIEEAAASTMFQLAPRFSADVGRIFAIPRACDIVRSPAARPHDPAAELQPVARELSMPGDRRLTGPVKLGKKGALASKRGKSVCVIDECQQIKSARIVRARLNANGALPNGRKDFFFAHDFGCVLSQSEPPHSGER